MNIKHTFSPQRSVIVVLLFLLNTLVTIGQVTIFQNGQSLLTGADSPLHPDSPTRKKIDLSGEWSYSFDESNWKTVKVPSAFDYEGQVTFVRKFVVDDETLSKRSLKLVALGINYEAELSVNDMFIGRHIGGSSSFEFEIPDNALRLGSENIIKVVVRNELNARNTVPLRKQIWGWRNYGGITRDIYLLSVPRTWIDALNIRTDVGKDLRQGLVRVVATITSGKSGRDEGENLRATKVSKAYLFHAELYDKSTNILVAQSPPEPVTIGQNRLEEVQASFSFPSAKLWSPDSPDLYRLVAKLVEGQGSARKEIDVEQRTVGFTKISLENRSVVINGTKMMLNGIVWHEDSPSHGSALTYEQMERDVQMMKSMGANAVRFEFHPPHPYMLSLCSRYGLFALEEIPVWNAPAAILAEEHFQVLAESVLREMIQRDRHEASLLAWGVGSDFDSSDPRARSYVERMASMVHTLDQRPAYFGSRMLANDQCSELVNIAAVSVPQIDEKEFRQVLTQWRDRHQEMPVIVLRYFKPVEHTNRNGWSDPLSEEAQAKFFESRYRIIKDLNFAGSFIESFSDWRGDRPIMTVHVGDPFIHPVGLTNFAREKRTAFEVVRSLYNEEKLASLPVGSYRASFPAAPLLFGLAVIFSLAYFINYNRRFADCFSRSLLRPYNFFADLRDLHAVASLHTIMLGLAIATTLAVVLVSFLYQFRTSMDVDFFLTQFVVSDWAKRQLIRASWSLFTGISVFTLVFLVVLVLVASLIKLFSAIVRAKIFWYHAYSIAVWGSLPFVFLIFPGIILLKLLETPLYVKPTLILVAIFLLWVLFRVLKGVAVIYNISPQKAYTGGLLFCFVCLGIVGFYYDSAYALRSYLEFIVHISRSLG